VNLNQEELSKMVNQLIVEIDNKWKETDFDFLIEQELLRTSLLDHISKKDLSTVHTAAWAHEKRLGNENLCFLL
jgi:hypothetical protein